MERPISARKTLERPTDSRFIIIPYGLENDILLTWAQRKIIGFANTYAIWPLHRNFTFGIRNFLSTKEHTDSLEYDYVQNQAKRYEDKVTQFISDNARKLTEQKRGQFARWAAATAVIAMYGDLIAKQQYSPVFSQSRNVLARRFIQLGAKLSDTEQGKELNPDWVNAIALRMWASETYSTESRNLLEEFVNQPQYARITE